VSGCARSLTGVWRGKTFFIDFALPVKSLLLLFRGGPLIMRPDNNKKRHGTLPSCGLARWFRRECSVTQ
jgi:hypothetical protein